MFSDNTFWITRFVFQRALAGLYGVGFLIVINQFKGLCGQNGLLPVDLFLQRTRFWNAPSLFWLNHSDGFMLAFAWLGLALSVFALIGYSDAFGSVVSIVTWLLLWLLYSSFVNVGQSFYGFGWEIMLLETGFLAIFMGASNSKPSFIMIILLQWLLFRLMFGAGLIKIRGDECWRDLTCMKYHYETMPLPGPTSRYFHFLPMWVHKGEVLFNHVVELVIPFFYFAPRPFRHGAGILTILFQATIISSGNFSWLNYLAIVVAFGCFDDSFFQTYLPKINAWADAMGVAGAQSSQAASGIPSFVTYALLGLIGVLSVAPVRNLISSSQIMNTSFDPFHLVNTYGAFGSITRVRKEIIIEGSNAAQGPWKEYEFKGKPGDISRTPPLVSPYHYKLDWQMWFAAMTSYQYHPWILNLMAKILQNNQDVLALLGPNPFPDHAPKFLRATLFRYQYAKLGDKNTWTREYIGDYLPPLSLDDAQFTDVLKAQGWLNE